jgi:DNA-binding response OmpR family regulator
MSAQGASLVAVSDAVLRDFIAEAVGDEGYVVYTADNTAGVQAILEARSVRLLITDLYFSSMTCAQFITELRATTRADIPVLIIADDPQLKEQLKLCPITCCLPMPFDLDEFLQCVAGLSRSPDQLS